MRVFPRLRVGFPRKCIFKTGASGLHFGSDVSVNSVSLWFFPSVAPSKIHFQAKPESTNF